MNTKINLTYNGVKYTLEYNRMSIKLLEKAGFKYEEFLEKPMTNIELAFTGAFIANHQGTNQNTIDDIFKHCGNKDKLLGTLNKMIDECYESLLQEPEDDLGNVTWEVIDLAPSQKKKSQE